MRLAMLLPAMLALAATDTGPLPESLDPSPPGAPRRRSRRPGPTPDPEPEPSDATKPSEPVEAPLPAEAVPAADVTYHPSDSQVHKQWYKLPVTGRSDSRPPVAWLLAEEKRQRKAERLKKTWTGRVL
jgi:hypothetical protein